MSAPPTVAIIGLGLIGGSLARDLAARGVRILGYDRDGAALAEAVAAGVVSRSLNASLDGLEAADWVVLAMPVDVAPAVLARVPARVGRARLITDVGSTKRRIVRAAGRLGLGPKFVGSHPLAGDVRSGWGASRTGLFAGARVFLCPATGAGARARREAAALWHLVGAIPEEWTAAAHDRALARTSHLPQVVASALAAMLSDAGVSPAELGPGGRSMTRLAASDPAMWTAIALDNAGELGPAVEEMAAWLSALRLALAAKDRDAVQKFFTVAAGWSALGV